MSIIDQIVTNIGLIVPNLNTSASSIVRKIAEVVGTIIDIIRLEMLRSEQTISQATKVARVTSQTYYVEQAYNYQDGDQLVVIDPSTQLLGYNPVDVNKQIIKQASIGINSLGVFFLNVATADSDNNIQSLSQDQLDAFREYYQNFIAMGAQCTVASNAPSIFVADNLYIRFYKTYNLEDIKSKINTALHDLQVVRRSSSRLYINEVESYLSAVDGVKDAYFAEPGISYEGTVTTPADGVIEMPSGYFNFDPAFYNFNANKTIFESV